MSDTGIRTERIRGAWDEDGFHLLVELEDGLDRFDFLISDWDELVAAVEPLRQHVEEGLRERAAYDRATPEERDRVLSRELPLDPDEALREGADLQRKRERENPREKGSTP